MDGRDDEDRVYAFGYSPAAVGLMESRSAEVHAAFFLKHLSSGMDVLDIGCGPGSITVGIASAVTPGEVVGVDIEGSQVELGRERAEALGLENCRFQVGSVFDLPMEDDSVDAIYGHTILMQFRELDAILAQVKRVLKPGGVIGFREIDFGASLYHADDSALRYVMSTLRRTILHNDGNPDVGRALPSILSGAGFQIISASATYACAATPEAKVEAYAAMARLWEQADFVTQAESLGWLDAEKRESIRKRLEDEGADPGSITGTSYVEVVGRVGPSTAA